MAQVNPLGDEPGTDPEDVELVRRAQAGSREALERLVGRHQSCRGSTTSSSG
jgi:hypothetical protein